MENHLSERLLQKALQAVMAHEIRPIVEMAVDKAARHAAEESVKQILIGLGFHADDPSEAQADMIFLRNLRHGSTQARRHVFHAMITVLASSFLWLVWDMMKQSLQR